MAEPRQFGGIESEASAQQHNQEAGVNTTGSSLASEPAGRLFSKAGEAAKEVKDFAVSKAHVRDFAGQQTKDVAALIRARPVESVLVGLAAGWFLGWLASKAFQSRRGSRRL